MKMKRSELNEYKKIALERIEILLNSAKREAILGNLKRADRYVKSAIEIGMKNRVSIPREYNRYYCKFCHACIHPKNSLIRINSRLHRVEISCFVCGKKTHYPYIRELKTRKQKKSGNKNS